MLNRVFFENLEIACMKLDTKPPPWDDSYKRPHLLIRVRNMDTGEFVTTSFWESACKNPMQFEITDSCLFDAFECILHEAQCGAMSEVEWISEYGSIDHYRNCSKFSRKVQKLLTVDELHRYYENLTKMFETV